MLLYPVDLKVNSRKVDDDNNVKIELSKVEFEISVSCMFKM
jgi:hypothetical protein